MVALRPAEPNAKCRSANTAKPQAMKEPSPSNFASASIPSHVVMASRWNLARTLINLAACSRVSMGTSSSAMVSTSAGAPPARTSASKFSGLPWVRASSARTASARAHGELSRTSAVSVSAAPARPIAAWLSGEKAARCPSVCAMLPWPSIAGGVGRLGGAKGGEANGGEAKGGMRGDKDAASLPAGETARGRSEIGKRDGVINLGAPVGDISPGGVVGNVVDSPLLCCSGGRPPTTSPP
mmetsp:Transcript_71639/g.207459  ORF Transcript_71639/g.207459 Transcript_71639/m.207459 type:complete len:240 (-) Transcript_71639:531-1250(-)